MLPASWMPLGTTWPTKGREPWIASSMDGLSLGGWDFTLVVGRTVGWGYVRVDT